MGNFYNHDVTAYHFQFYFFVFRLPCPGFCHEIYNIGLLKVLDLLFCLWWFWVIINQLIVHLLLEFNPISLSSTLKMAAKYYSETTCKVWQPKSTILIFFDIIRIKIAVVWDNTPCNFIRRHQTAPYHIPHNRILSHVLIKSLVTANCV